MDWTKFSNHGESNNHAFEVMCNLLFESWCKEIYKEKLSQFAFVNGDGGDGGVEAYSVLINGNIVAVQSKWFPEKISEEQIRQINSSFRTAIKIRPNIIKYIVCIPRDLGSKKIGRGGNVVNNTEADRWERLVSDCKAVKPNTEIILWDETTIQERLTKPESQGIYRYWFENTIIFDNLFAYSYEKVVNGWAKLKYIPEIHTAGYIHNYLEYFLGSAELTERRYKEVCAFIHRFELLLRSYEDLLTLGIPENTKDLGCKIKKDLPILKKWLKRLEVNKEIIRSGGSADFIAEALKLNCSINDIKNSPLHFGKYFHFHEAEKLLDNFEDDFFNFRRLLDNRDNNKVVFLGMQGTGKTAGMIAEASLFLNNRVHLPVIIHAKEFSEGDTWASMIISSLGLESTWNEIELFGALQNAALLRGYTENQKFRVEPKCVIMVDGIDEAISWEFWRNKINETEAFQSNFPRIKFVFFSRPYVFDAYYKLPYKNSIYSIPSTGDGELEEICDKYFSTYKIDIGDNNWVKNNLKSPIAVKLFCDIYRGKKISTLPQNTIVLTELYKAKIALLEEDYNKNGKGISGFKVIHTALIELAELFAQKQSIQYQDIYDRVSIPLKSILNEILTFLINEGFIYTFTNQEDDFSVPETFYSWGMQPVFDYLIAQKIYNSIDTGSSIEINCINGIFQMLSLIAIEKGKLLIEYKQIKIKDQEAFKLICYALANCSINTAGKYSEYTKGLMRYSVEKFREVFSNVIQQVMRSDRHPLGSVLLDEFLREFDNSAERDVWWSIPSYLRDGYDTKWYSYTELDFESIKLHRTDKYCAAPLTLAWSLSSVNNTVRQSSRLKLTEWGIANPMEFWNLFKKCTSINDMQVLEDVFAIAYGIALSQFVCKEYLRTASQWILDNLFSKSGLKEYENVALRYYGTGIVKIAVARGIFNDEIVQTVTPPYNYKTEFLELYKEALGSSRMGGYKAIDYDLARYVLCDHLDKYFRTEYETRDYHKNAKIFMEKYRVRFKLPDLKVEGLIIAAAYQYLLNQGWNTEEFWISDDRSKVGIDCAILRTYHSATHGEMSRIMTVAEKNVWLAKHQIEAVFSNNIPICEDYKNYQFIKDYSQVEDFINTYQDYANTLHRSQTHSWFNADLLAITDFEIIDKEKIESWMQKETIPPFDNWFSVCNGNIILSASTSVKNNLSGVEETVWIASGAVKKGDFTNLLVAIENDFEDREEMLNVDEFCAYQECRCYCTPQEACLVHSEREINSCFMIQNSNGNIEVDKLVEECLSSDEVETERSFTLPSKLARKLTGIVYGDGFSYWDDNGNVIANYSNGGENWGTYQKTLMIKNDALEDGLEKTNLKMFWLFRVYREPTPKAVERYEKIMRSSDRTYFVWQEADHFKYKEIFQIERPRNDYQPEISYNIDAFLEKYGF